MNITVDNTNTINNNNDTNTTNTITINNTNVSENYSHTMPTVQPTTEIQIATTTPTTGIRTVISYQHKQHHNTTTTIQTPCV